jgi:Na+/melibiose symporter-like transporter
MPDLTTADVPVVLVLSLILLVVFMLWERHLENNTTFPPIAKFSLFTRHRYRFTALMGCAFFCCITTPGFVYTATIWYQELKGETALQNAILLLPCNIMGLGAAGGAMYVVPRYKAPHLIAFGGFMCG